MAIVESDLAFRTFIVVRLAPLPIAAGHCIRILNWMTLGATPLVIVILVLAFDFRAIIIVFKAVFIIIIGRIVQKLHDRKRKPLSSSLYSLKLHFVMKVNFRGSRTTWALLRFPNPRRGHVKKVGIAWF